MQPTILIATSNPGKLAEYRSFLSGFPLKHLSLDEARIAPDAPETGSTFRENAVMKARYYAGVSGFPTIADDGGFEIDALGGQPGVYSHRWIHRDREDTDEELIAYTVRRMEGVPVARRGAQLRVVVAFAVPSGDVVTSEASIRGVIPGTPSGKIKRGFPYRSLFFIPEIGKFYDQDVMTEEESCRYNHRRIAVEALKAHIKKSFGV